MVELRLAEAQFRVWEDPPARQRLVDSAVGLLVAGTDTPTLRILAGEDRADLWELGRELDAALGELGLELLDYRGSLLLLAEELASWGLAGDAAAVAAAGGIHRLYNRHVELHGWPSDEEWPAEATRLLTTAECDGYFEDACIPLFIEAAREYLASRK